ncbi:MAG: hypothetical protein WCQ95_02365 [Bacteroidota bacterium]
MTTRDSLRVTAISNGQNICAQHIAILATVPEYLIEKTIIEDLMVRIETAKRNNTRDNTPQAKVKTIAFNFMINTINKFRLRASVKANQLNAVGLESALTHPISNIRVIDDSTSATKAESLKEIMKTNLGILTNLTNADILEMENAILEFRAVLYSPQFASKNNKTEGTMLIPELVKEAQKHSNLVGRILLSYIPEATLAWETATRIGKSTGVRYISVAVHFAEANSGLQIKNVKATFTDGKNTITKFSTVRGWVRISSMQQGSWDLTYEHATFLPGTKTRIVIQPNKMAKVQIKLQKIPA